LRRESPLIESLAARIQVEQGSTAGALATLKAAISRYPNRRPLVYAYASALQAAGRPADTLSLVSEQLRLYPRDDRLHGLQARAYAALGRRLQQHRAQAEVYALQGSLAAAVEQLQLAQTAGDGDFYELSAVDARLRVLRDEHLAEMKEQRRR
jgi:predicted Zn-dependent protease